MSEHSFYFSLYRILVLLIVQFFDCYFTNKSAWIVRVVMYRFDLRYTLAVMNNDNDVIQYF